jgi:hypothetical protein
VSCLYLEEVIARLLKDLIQRLLVHFVITKAKVCGVRSLELPLLAKVEVVCLAPIAVKLLALLVDHGTGFEGLFLADHHLAAIGVVEADWRDASGLRVVLARGSLASDRADLYVVGLEERMAEVDLALVAVRFHR